MAGVAENTDSDSSAYSDDSFVENTLLPYSFEPSISRPPNRIAQSSQSDVGRRIGNVDWCCCNNCLPMQTYTESTCCHDYLNSGEIPEKLFEGKDCITSSSEFTQVCLSRPVLRTALIGINDLRGDGVKRHPDAKKGGEKEKDEIPNKSYRFAGYKQYTWWVHQRLGKGVRRVIPSCALWAIRNQYPSSDGNYKPFEEKKDDEDNFI